MFFGRWTSGRAISRAHALSRFLSYPTSAGLLITAGLLTGCGEAGSPMSDIYADYEPAIAWTQPSSEFTPVANLQTEEDSQNQFWSFPSEGTENAISDTTTLIPLPPLEEPALAEEVAEVLLESGEDTPDEQLIATLLPSQAIIPLQPVVVEQAPLSEPPLEFSPTDLNEINSEEIAGVEESPLPVLAELSEQEQLVALFLQDSSSAATGVLTDSRVNELAKTKIQHAYAMANRGALYVARQKLIEVLRMISQEKDAQQGTPERAAALAAGLRALREAEDFAPSGTQLEAELEIDVLCASHRTPVAKQADSAKLLPRLMMDRYFRYAQLQLAMSVAGEPAGSMALHALGKLNGQLGRVEPEKHRLADRHAIAFQQAALLAHNQNFLAAHELGVLLATAGHFAESQQLLLQVATREPNAVVYRNLARVQEKLGQQTLAHV